MALEDTREDRRGGLKRATEVAHARVEAIIQQAGMFGSIAGYRRYLEATWRVRIELEQALDASGAEQLFPAWPRRRIAPLIAADVADLGGSLPSPVVNPPRLFSPSELLGVLYVLEGSSLGARVLVRNAADLGLSGAFGARHLDAQAGDRATWAEFLAVLTASDETPSASAANSVFDMFANAYAAEAVLG